MAITLAAKSDIRRHLGYPVAGLIQTSVAGATFASGAIGYRFTQAYGFLEYKMNNLNPDEESRLTGNAYGAVAFLGPQPHGGDTVSVTLSGGPLVSPVVLSATAPTPSPNIDGRLSLAQLIAAAGSQNAALQAAGIISVAPYGTGPFAQTAIPIPECAFVSPSAFSIACGGSGVLIPQITATGVQLNPSASLDGINTIWGYLNILNGLENAYAGTSQNLDTIQADVWKGRANEAGQRMSLYSVWVQFLSDFLGTPINPEKRNNARSVGAMRFA